MVNAEFTVSAENEDWNERKYDSNMMEEGLGHGNIEGKIGVDGTGSRPIRRSLGKGRGEEAEEEEKEAKAEAMMVKESTHG